MLAVINIMLVLSFPIHYTLEITQECNQYCSGCGNVGMGDKGKGLSSIEWKKIFEEIKPHAANIRISGGEPTLHPEFEDIIYQLKYLDLSFVLFTNAQWADAEKLCGIIKTVEQCDGMLISLHGADANTHESFTKTPGSFHNTIKNIELAIREGLRVATSTVITKYNFQMIDRIVKLGEALGVESVIFARYLPVRDFSLLPSAEQLRHAMDDIDKNLQLQKPVQFSVCIPQCFYRSASEGCHSGVTYCVIDHRGNIRPCTHSKKKCGNLFDKKLKVIWNSREMNEWRNMIAQDCYDCSALSICHGGCRAAAELQNLDYDPLKTRPFIEKLDLNQSHFEFHAQSKPLGNFKIKTESFGYVLIRKNIVLPVSFEAKPILDAIGEQKCLSDIKLLYGQKGLDFIGLLFQKGLLDIQ